MRPALLLLLFLCVGADGNPPALRFPLASAGGQGGVFWIANEGQWPGNFQFKCEVGNTTYYVTPKGMTIDIHEYSLLASNDTRSSLPARHSAVAPSSLGKNPQDHPDPFNPVVILNEVKYPSERPASIRGHVIQIHYASGLPPFTGERKGGLSAGASPSAGVPAPPQSDIPPRFSGGQGGVKNSPTIPTTS
jgi:hypothetical protein